MRYSKGQFRLKEDQGKSLIIEGMANVACADRVKETIPPDAWELDNFAKNPIIFFNHNRDIPIGKAIDFKVTDKGLWMKVRLSRSNSAPIPMIRDLVEEGILKTFSVGFDDHDSAEKGMDGVSFKRAELLETSIVTIPMNQESTFQVVGSASKSGTVYQIKQAKLPTTEELKTMSYDDLKFEVLNEKGAFLAAAIHTAFGKAEKEGDNKEDLFNEIVLESDLDPEMIRDIMLGEVTPAPSEFLEAAAKVLGIDVESLRQINQGESPKEEPAPEEKPEEPKEDEESGEEMAKSEEKPEEKPEEPKPAEEKPEDPKEDEEDMDKLDKDFQECVSSKIPKFIDEGMERDQAIAASISYCQDKKGCTIKPTDKHYEAFIELADNHGKQEEKQADQGDSSNGPTAPLTKEDDYTDIGQPALDLQKTQIALAGEMVNALREAVVELRAIKDYMMPKEPEESEESEPMAEPEQPMASEDEEKMARIAKIEKDIDEIAVLKARYLQLTKFDYYDDDE